MMTIPAPVLLTVILQLLMAVSATGQFTVEPVSVVQAEGLEAVFECLHPGANSYNWGINGTFPPEDDFPLNGVVRQTQASGGTPAKLTIPATEEYNNTAVKCEAVVREGGRLMGVLSENASLLVQGPLQSVSNLRFKLEQLSPAAITISWTPPFSLNLTTTTAGASDIQYCVNVYTDNNTLVDSVCDIINTTYTYTPNSAGNTFNFTVTPRSNVDGSLNGTTSQPVEGFTCTRPPQVESIQYEGTVMVNGFMMNVSYLTQNGAGRSCPVMDTSIMFVPNNGTPFSCSMTPSNNGSHESLILSSDDCSVERHSLYNISVQRKYNGGVSNSSMLPISTHDVQRPQVSNYSQRGQIDVNCTYLDNTTDLGLFVIVHSQGKHNFDYHAQARDQETLSQLSIPGLVNTEYCVLVYDFESNGVPRSTPAAMPTRVIIEPVSNSIRDYPAHHNVSASDGEIQIECSTECVGIIHIADMSNCTLYTLEVLRVMNGSNSTTMAPGEYHVAVFLSSGSNLTFDGQTNVTVSAAASPTTTMTASTSTSADLPDPAGAIAGALLAVIVFSAVILAVAVGVACWFKSQRKKQQMTMEPPSLHDPENHVYSVGPPDISGPSMPTTQVEHYRSSQYENVNRATPQVIVREPPPPYEDVASSQTPSPATGSSSIDLEGELQPPQPPSYQHQDSVRSYGQLEATSNTTLLPEGSPELPQHVQHGTASASTLTSVKQLTQQPNLGLPTEVNTNSTTEPAYNNIPQGTKVKHATSSEQLPPQPQLDGFTPQEPAYDVVNKVMVKQATTTDPPADGTKTEHQYSEIQGTVTMSGAHYAHVDLKSKTRVGTESSVDPTTVVYSEIDKKKLAPVNESETPQPKPVTKPPPPPPPTAETVLYEIHPVAKSWYELGEALGVPESALDNIDTEGSDQVRLHDMIQTYFSSRYYTHTWERIAEALHEIGEIEAADRIVRTRELKATAVTLSTPSVQADPPPLPPRNGTPEGSNGETINGGFQQNKEEPGDIDDIENEQYTGGVEFMSSSDQASDDKGAAGRKTENLKRPRVDPAVALKNSKDFLSSEFQVENGGQTTPSIPVHDWPVTMDRCEEECTLLSNQSSHRNIPYHTLMLHSLGIFEKLDVSKNQKIRALGYMNSSRHASEVENLYQQKMSDKCSDYATANVNNSCAVSQECGELGASSLVSLSATNKNLWDREEFTKAQKDMTSYCRKGFQNTCLISVAKDNVPETGSSRMTALVTGVKCAVAVVSVGVGQLVTGVGPKQAVLSGESPSEESSSSVVVEDVGYKDVYLLEAHRRKAQSIEQGSHYSSFFSPPAPFCYKQCGQGLKGILLREHGCIFQPEDEDTCLLGSAAASGELWWNSITPKLCVKLVLFSETEPSGLTEQHDEQCGKTPLTVACKGQLIAPRNKLGEVVKLL